jgi:DNA repair exonuclease SbcCD ATPase subunit
MELTLSIPTLLICLIIVFLFRFLDKKNRGLEKLKRFSDKTKEELSVFIKDKSLELNDLSANIDSQLKKSREILTRILSFEETLQGKADDFDKMKKTVDTYAASLDELINMSGRVDENLKRLGEESQSVEKMGAKLKEAGARLAKLDAELKTTERRIIEQARGELRETEERLIKVHDEKIHALLGDVGRLEARAGELETYLKRLELKKQEAVKLAEAAIGQALKSFEQDVGKRRAQESAGLKAEIDALLKEADDRNQAMTDNLAQVEKRVKELDGEFTAKIDDFKDQFGQVERMFYTHLENAAKRGEDFEDEVFLNLKKSIDERGREAERESERYFQTAHDSLDKRKKEIVELFGALRADTNIWHAELRKQMKQQEKEIETQLKNLETFTKGSIENFTLTAQQAEQSAEEKVGKSVGAMQAKMKELEAGFAESRRVLSERTAGFEKDIRERLALLEKEVKSLVSSFDREVTDKIAAAGREAKQLFEKINAGANGVETRVLDSIEKRLGEYEDAVQYRFGKLEKANVDIEALDRSLRETMASTADGIRAEFGAFSQSLEAERAAERERSEQELESLQQTVAEAAVKLRTDMASTARELEGERAAERERAGKELERLQQTMAEAAEKLRTDMASTARELEGERAAERARAGKELESLREEIEGIEAGVNDLKAKAYANVSSKLKLVEDEFFGDIRAQSEEMKQKIAGWREEIMRDLAAAEASSAEEIEKLGAAHRKRLEKELAGLRKSLEADFKGLESRVGQFEQGCEERIAAKEELLSGLSATLAAEVEAVREKALAQAAAVAESIEKSRDKAAAAQKSFFESFDAKMKAVESNLAEIERHQKNFVAQTKIFERADTLKLGLEADLSQMKKDIVKIEAYRKDIDEISKEFFATKKLVDETNAKMRDFLTEKKRIDGIEADFQKLLDLSRSIDEKLETAAGQHDLLQGLEIKFRELESIETDVETRYTRLEGRKTVVETTTRSVDKNFEQLTALERNLKVFERELKSLPKLVGDVKKEVEFINGSKEKTEKVVGRIEKLDDTLADIEARMEKLSVARDWLARTETRLEQVGKQAEDQLKLLETLVKDDVSRFKKEKGAPSPDKRQTVTKLARQGWSAEEIARATKLSRGEVELILELISDKVGR